MKRFIFEERNGLYIIDLAKTLQLIRSAVEVVSQIAGRKSIMFVGTKKQAKAVVRECAEDCGEFYVCERWLGGALTNLTTIRNSVKPLERIEKRIAVLVNREHEELHLGHGELQLAHALESFHAGHVDVHEDDIGRVAWNFFQRHFAVSVIAGKFEGRRLADKRREAGTDAFVIIHDGYFDLHLLSNDGNHAVKIA